MNENQEIQHNTQSTFRSNEAVKDETNASSQYTCPAIKQQNAWSNNSKNLFPPTHTHTLFKLYYYKLTSEYIILQNL